MYRALQTSADSENQQSQNECYGLGIEAFSFENTGF